jgi:5-methylcytosine-specific restriction endonuclease McrA
MSPRTISAALRQRVAEAARFRCGYCLTAQRIIGPLLEIDHLIPESRGGTSDEENLWLACHSTTEKNWILAKGLYERLDVYIPDVYRILLGGQLGRWNCGEVVHRSAG